jgi:hypothetical protein
VGGTSISAVCGASRCAVLRSSKRGEAGKYSGALEFVMQGGATLEGEERWEADPGGRLAIFGWWPSTSNLPVYLRVTEGAGKKENLENKKRSFVMDARGQALRLSVRIKLEQECGGGRMQVKALDLHGGRAPLVPLHQWRRTEDAGEAGAKEEEIRFLN